MTTKYARGSDVTLNALLLDNSGNPLVPYDSTYPQIEIINPDGTTIASGVGLQSLTQAGNWSFSWSIPASSEIKDGWLARWTLLNNNREIFVRTFTFELYDQIEAQDALDRDGTYLVMRGKTERAIYRSTVQPYDVNLTVRDDTGENRYIYAKAELTEVFADGLWNYYIDLPPFTEAANLLLIWDVLETQVSRRDQHVQWLKVAPDTFWFALPYLKGLIDRLNKLQTNILGYTTAQMLTFFEQGLSFLNSIHPLTSWTMDNVPQSVWSWWVLASGLYALNGKQLLEIELNHNFTGQTVSLEYDRAGPLSEVISRWESLLWDKFISAKVSLYRRVSGPGCVGVRPYRLSYYDQVYKVTQSTIPLSDWPNVLSNLGFSI